MKKNKLIIELPGKFIFSTTIPVRITDINYGQHLGNDSLVGILHEARARFLNEYNHTELNVEGVGIIISSLLVLYKQQAFYKDELEISLGIGEVTASRTSILYLVKNTQNEIEVARAETVIAFMEYETKKVCRTPQFFSSLTN